MHLLNDILKKCAALGIYEKRVVSDKYCELIIYNKEIDEWKKVFTDILGTAVKSPEEKPTKEDIRLTEPYGGVRGNQMLFKKELGDSTVIAMFWPWQSGPYTTLKIALLS